MCVRDITVLNSSVFARHSEGLMFGGQFSLQQFPLIGSSGQFHRSRISQFRHFPSMALSLVRAFLLLYIEGQIIMEKIIEPVGGDKNSFSEPEPQSEAFSSVISSKSSRLHACDPTKIVNRLVQKNATAAIPEEPVEIDRL